MERKKKEVSFVITKMRNDKAFSAYKSEHVFLLSYKVNGITMEAPRRETLEDALSLMAWYIKTECKEQEQIDIKIIQ